MSEAGIAAVDDIAKAAGVSRSEAVRALLAEALASPPVLRAAKARLKT
jgi:metal-responsive CopG/Arc/MetJ family transcriptional regulator